MSRANELTENVIADKDRLGIVYLKQSGTQLLNCAKNTFRFQHEETCVS